MPSRISGPSIAWSVKPVNEWKVTVLRSDRKTMSLQIRPDGSLVVTLTNPDKCVDITLAVGGKNYRVAMPDDSMVTMVFEKEDLE